MLRLTRLCCRPYAHIAISCFETEALFCPSALPARSALKTKGNTPKYGLIFHSSFIGRAKARNKGRISRYLANKCSIASRIDCFMDTATSAFGEKLKDQVEERLRFYEDGVAPRKNITVMQVGAHRLVCWWTVSGHQVSG
jgi:hypothetical protein